MVKINITTADDLDGFFERFINNQNEKGVIKLTKPVLNINEWRNCKPSYYSLLLGLKDQDVDKIVYYSSMVVKKSSCEKYTPGQIITPEEFSQLEKSGDKIELISGAEAIEFLLGMIDTDVKLNEARDIEKECMVKLEPLKEKYYAPETESIRESLWEKSRIDLDNENYEPEYTEEEREYFDLRNEIDKLRKELYETRCLIDALFRVKYKKLDSLIIREIEIFPVEMRGIIKEAVKSNPYAMDDLEDHYRRIANRNARLDKLMNLGAPEIILRNESRVLQEYVDILIANGRRGRPYMGPGKDPRCQCASLTDIILRQLKLM